MKHIYIFFIFIISNTCVAETLWTDYSVSLLKGSNYKVGDNKRTVFTFEHAAGYNWGDSFLFVDRLQSNNGNKETYIEISPRFTISPYKNKLMNNIFIATTVEMGEGFTHYLIGLGTQLQVPYFKYFNFNLYHRNNDSGENSEQITINWALPLRELTYDGFIDMVPSTKLKSHTINFTSQLKYNLAPILEMKNKLYVGVEYVWWQNKFGIKGVDENNLNLLIKYHF